MGAKPEFIGLGFFLLVIGVIILFNAMPTMTTAVQSGAGTTFENSSTSIKQILGTYEIFIASLPYILVSIGVVLMGKGAMG